jgi:hypothetical protein
MDTSIIRYSQLFTATQRGLSHFRGLYRENLASPRERILIFNKFAGTLNERIDQVFQHFHSAGGVGLDLAFFQHVAAQVVEG